MKRLLLIGSPKPDRLEHYYAKAFTKLGVELTVFDPLEVAAALRANRVMRRATLAVRHLLVHHALLRFYRNPSWDAVFVIKGYDLPADTIEACRRRARGIVWSVLNPDSPFEHGLGASSRHMRESMTLFDTYFTWSRDLVSRLAAAGVSRPYYLPFAHDEDTHRWSDGVRIDPDLAKFVTFIGTFDPDRAQVLETLADFPLRIFGMDWERLPRRSPLRPVVRPGIARGAASMSIAASSAVSLNILRPQNRGAHNMRTFELPAMRGVMLTGRSSEQQEFFPEGEACFMYGETGELRRHVESALAGAYDLGAIRDTALKYSARHSYLERAREVCKQLGTLC